MGAGSTSDFHFIECADAEDGVAKILQIVRERIPAAMALTPSATSRCCAR
jgi:hypothetical protein